MFPEAGEKLGPYEILGELGGGGMARVYRAWDGRLHREVAIKVIDDRFAMPGIGERFLREARAASGLNHPNICTIFDIGEQDGAPYLVMELLEGETLRERINLGSISVEEILRHGAEVSDALAAAHARGIVHRDVKPANIFLVKKPNGSTQAKVLDFGLAKIEQYASEERDFASNLTSMGATVGTVSYMSPEQARGEKLDARSDLFSLGIVMYEMATGQLPFQGNTSALVFVQLLGQMAPEAVRKLNGQIPPDLDQLIMKLLAKNPRTRFQSATELCDELHELAEKRSGWLTRLKTPPPAQAPAPAVREPLPRAANSPRIVDPPRPKPPTENSIPGASSGEAARALPARPGDPQGVRAPGRRRKDSAEHKSQQKKVQPRSEPRNEVRPEARGEGSSGQLPVAPGAPGDLPSGVRPVRTSIATNPKMSYPATAPYQSGLHRAAPAESKPEDRPGERPAQSPAAGFSGLRQVVRDPRPSGVRAAARSPFADRVEDDEAESAEGGPGSLSWKWIALAIALLVLVAGLLAWRFGWLGGAAPMQGGVLLLTHLRNSTGDATLDAAFLQGLEIDLMESRGTAVRGPLIYESQYRKAGISGDASPERMREIAGRVGATRYLAGEIKGSDGAAAAPFTISLDVMDAGSDRRLAHIEQTAANKSVLLDAVDGIAAQVRSAIGESESSIAGANTPLRFEGSLSIDALDAYFQGRDALQQGRIADALGLFEKAAEADPHFALAQTQLAVLCREQLSAVKAAAAARAAASASANAANDRVKLLAEFRRELDAEGDLESALKTIQRFVELYPLDASGLEGLSEVLRMQGRFAESLQAAEKAVALDPFDLEIYWQAEQSMLCVNRFDSVAHIEAAMQTAGLPSAPDSLLAYYLSDKRAELGRKLIEAKNSPGERGLQARRGFMLDDEGRLNDGEAVWRADSGSGDGSKAASLARGALDRALAGECKASAALLREASTSPRAAAAAFDTGLAAALCGDVPLAAASLAELQRSLPANTAAREYMVPDLKAAMALKAGNASGALSYLKAAGTYDLVSLTPYLRGLAHEASNQPGLAIADFEIELAHRGALAAQGSTLYPMAEFHIARAYASSGDNASSAAAYRTFAELWKGADPSQRLLLEARSHAH